MAICELHFSSASLGRQTACNLIIPQGQDAPWSVFYLLHGASDDHTIWSRRTSIERYVDGLPLLVVMPEGGGTGFYTDAANGSGRYESAIIEDLIPFMDAIFPTRPEKAGRCIGGLSMGGYGAMKLALKHPDLFCSANSHSGAVSLERMVNNDNPDWRTKMRGIFGEGAVGGTDDPFALARNGDPATRPALKIDCGTEDFLLDSNRSFHAHLEECGVPHQYDEFPGGHQWSYWDTHIQEALAFHRGHLGI